MIRRAWRVYWMIIFGCKECESVSLLGSLKLFKKGLQFLVWFSLMALPVGGKTVFEHTYQWFEQFESWRALQSEAGKGVERVFGVALQMVGEIRSF